MTTPKQPTIGLRNPLAAIAPLVHLTAPGPIMMVETKPRGLGEDQRHGNNRPRAANGKRTKLPSLASTGIDAPDDIHPNARRGRYEFRVDTSGRTIPFILSCGAGHLVNTKGRFVTDPHARERLSKAWGLAWYSVEDDAPCLIEQIAAGECNPRRIVDRSILADEACTGPCKHFAIEAAARAAKSEAAMEELEAATRREDPSIAIAKGVLAALREVESSKKPRAK